MAFSVGVGLAYEFTVRAAVDEVFSVLADVPTSASFYPKLERLVDLGGGAYRWEMERIGIAQASLQTVYAAHYTSDAQAHTVQWTPLEGVGNARVRGRWSLSGAPAPTTLVLEVHADIDIPLPALMHVIAAALVEAEFEKLTERYIANLITRFGGEV